MRVARFPAPGVAARSVRWHPLVLLPLALSLLVFFPITRVFFFADDFLHLANIASGQWLNFVLAPFGGHNLHLRNLAFLGSWWLFGFNPEPFYWTVLITHLVNVWLLFGVLALLTDSVLLACFGAILWGTSPLGVGTLGFYSVYGQVMATTGVLVVLDRFAAWGQRDAPVPPRTAWGCYALLLAGTTCFGTAIGVACVAPLVLFLMVPAAWWQRRIRFGYCTLPVVTLAAYFALKRLYLLLDSSSLVEMYQEALAYHGLPAVPMMLSHLLGFGVAGTTLGFFFDPDQYGTPGYKPGWVAIACFLVGLVLLLWRGDAQTRRDALAMAVLAFGAYSVIAVGRGNLYSAVKVPPARAAAYVRYHYLATFPIAVLWCLILRQLLASRAVLSVVAVGIAVMMLLGYRHAAPLIDEHVQVRAFFERTAQEVTAAVAAAPPGGPVVLENGTTPGCLGYFLEIRIPGRAGAYLLLASSGRTANERRVRFIERDPKILAYWTERPTERMTELLIPPPEP